jgi:hypothetical protein
MPKATRLACECCLALIVCCLTLLFFYRTHLFGHELHFTLDKYDSLIELSKLEHWFGVYRGWYYWRNPIYFYPEKGVLGYGDAYFLYGAFYSALRFFDVNPLISMEFTTATVRGVGFLAAWALLRRYFGSYVLTATFGAVLMTVSNGIYLGTMHTQLATVAFMPVSFFLAARTWELLIKERRWAAAGTATGLGFLLVAWLMTAFYTFWFAGLFSLVAIGAFAVLGRAQLVAVLRETLGKRRWRVLVPGMAIFGLGLLPFALTHLPTARATGMHAIDVIYFYTPQLLDFVNVGPGNLVWSGMSTWLHDIMLGPTKTEELWQGFTPIELTALGIAAVAAFARSETRSRSSLIYQSLLVAIFFSMALEVQIGGFSLWAWIYKLVPGARAVRVVVRFQLVLLTIGALVIAIALERLALNQQIWHRKLITILIGTAILAEQVNVFPIARLTRSDVLVFAAPPPPATCRVFYTVNPLVTPGASESERKYYIHSVQAMVLATLTRMPTVLGMDAFVPPGWNLHSPLSADYDIRVYTYAERRGLLEGLCTIDLQAMTWRLIDRPPDAPRTHPLGSGLEDRDQVVFAAGQAGVSMLAEGWSEPEGWGVWAVGTQSTLSLRLSNNPFRRTGVNLSVTAGAFLRPGIDSKKIDVFLGDSSAGDPLTQWKLTASSEEHKLCIPASAIPQDRLVKLTFKAERSYSPADAGTSTDSRVLNIGLESLSVNSKSCTVNSP